MPIKDPERRRAYNRNWRAQRQDERVMREGRWFHPRAPHGTASGYSRFGCRCRPCTVANTDDCAARKVSGLISRS